jgi:hypothetical protein
MLAQTQVLVAEDGEPVLSLPGGYVMPASRVMEVDHAQAALGVLEFFPGFWTAS